MFEIQEVKDVRYPGVAVLRRLRNRWEVSFIPQRGEAVSRRIRRGKNARFYFDAVRTHGPDGLLFPAPRKGLTAYQLYESIPEWVPTQPFYVYLRSPVTAEQWYDAVAGALKTCRAGAYDIARALVEQGFAVGFNWGAILHGAKRGPFEVVVAVDCYQEYPAFVLDDRELFLKRPRVLHVRDPVLAALWEERRLARREGGVHA